VDIGPEGAVRKTGGLRYGNGAKLSCSQTIIALLANSLFSSALDGTMEIFFSRREKTFQQLNQIDKSCKTLTADSRWVLEVK
jgi:hypothetical protein